MCASRHQFAAFWLANAAEMTEIVGTIAGWEGGMAKDIRAFKLFSYAIKVYTFT